MHLLHGISLLLITIGVLLSLIGLLGLARVMARRRPRPNRPRVTLRHHPKELMAACVLFGLLSFFALPARAQGVYQPNFYKVYSTILTNGQTLTLTNTAFWDVIRQGSGEGVFLQAVATNTTAAVVTSKFDVTPDGTNYTTTQPFQLSLALTSTTLAMNYTNFADGGSQPTLNNARKIALTSLSNAHTNSVTVTVWLSHSNQ